MQLSRIRFPPWVSTATICCRMRASIFDTLTRFCQTPLCPTRREWPDTAISCRWPTPTGRPLQTDRSRSPPLGECELSTPMRSCVGRNDAGPYDVVPQEPARSLHSYRCNYVHSDPVAARRALKGVIAAGSNGEVQWCSFAPRLNDMPPGSRRIRICAKHLDAVGLLVRLGSSVSVMVRPKQDI